jgi:hypothetical protein
VVSILVSIRFKVEEITGVIIIVGIQLAVRDIFQESPFNCIDLVIWWQGNLPNRRNSAGGEEPLARLHI